MKKKILKSLSLLKPGQLEKRKPISEKHYEASDIRNNEDGFLTVDDRVATTRDNDFLFNLQQTKKRLHDPDCKRILENIGLFLSLVTNSHAKKMFQPIQSKTIEGHKFEMARKASKKQRLDDEHVACVSRAEKISTRAWETFRF